MQKASTPSILGVLSRLISAHQRLCMVFACLSAIFINTNTGNCGDESQKPSSGTSIVIKENNPSGVSINVKEKTPFNELISGIEIPTTVPRVVLNVGSSQDKSFPSSTIHTIREIDGNSNSTVKIPSASIVPIQSPTATNVNIAHSQFPKSLVTSETASPREPSRLKVEAAALSSKSSPDRISLDIPPRTSQPTSQSFATSLKQSAPQPAAQIATQQVAPPLIPKPAAQIVVQPAPRPTPQPTAQIATQQVAPPIISQPASQIVVQPAPQPTPQPAAQIAQQVAPSFIPQPTDQIVFQQATRSLECPTGIFIDNPATYSGAFASNGDGRPGTSGR